MNHERLRALADDLEGMRDLEPTLAAETSRLLQEAFPDHADEVAEAAAGGQLSTEAVLRLIYAAIPDWSISLEGTARERTGRWTCTLRESTIHDEDQIIGVATAAALPLALLAALLRVAWRTAERHG